MTEGGVRTRFAVVANPAASGGRVQRDWERLRASVEAAWGDVIWLPTEGPGHAHELGAQAREVGAQAVVAMGGDGTLSEVVAGFTDHGRRVATPSDPAVGLLPAGTGGDYRRLLEARSWQASLESIRTARATAVDVGRVERPDGAVRGFVNIASFGIGGLVDQYVNDGSHRGSGRWQFLRATLRALRDYRPATVRLRLDGVAGPEVTVSNVAAAIGQYFGGGMFVAPQARIADGLLDVVAIPAWSTLQSLLRMRHLYNGSLLEVPGVFHARARVLEVERVSEHAWLDIDGEPWGEVPARIECGPATVQMIGVRAEVLS